MFKQGRIVKWLEMAGFNFGKFPFAGDGSDIFADGQKMFEPFLLFYHFRFVVCGQNVFISFLFCFDAVVVVVVVILLLWLILLLLHLLLFLRRCFGLCFAATVAFQV